MFKISRKTIVIAAMVVLLAVTGILNWSYLANKEKTDKSGEQPVSKTGEVEAANFFSAYKAERVTNREDEIVYLDSIITGESTDAQTLTEAQKMKMDLVANMELEGKVEGLLMAKGFEDAIVTFGSDSVNVVVKDADLTGVKVAQILDVVLNETDYSAEAVKVISAA